jgi:hypothetical protein
VFAWLIFTSVYSLYNPSPAFLVPADINTVSLFSDLICLQLRVLRSRSGGLVTVRVTNTNGRLWLRLGALDRSRGRRSLVNKQEQVLKVDKNSHDPFTISYL